MDEIYSYPERKWIDRRQTTGDLDISVSSDSLLKVKGGERKLAFPAQRAAEKAEIITATFLDSAVELR